VALGAVVDALSATRPPVAVSAAILAIAWVESGFNPHARNPHSSACGIFQFVKGTGEGYGITPDRCTDPRVNAWAGVRHLTRIYERWVLPSMPSTDAVPGELQRAEQIYRLLYAHHYHGSASAQVRIGGSIDSQQPASTGLPRFRTFYDIVKRAVGGGYQRSRQLQTVAVGTPAPLG
jgi:hypothetical protein